MANEPLPIPKASAATQPTVRRPSTPGRRRRGSGAAPFACSFVDVISCSQRSEGPDALLVGEYIEMRRTAMPAILEGLWARSWRNGELILRRTLAQRSLSATRAGQRDGERNSHACRTGRCRRGRPPGSGRTRRRHSGICRARRRSYEQGAAAERERKVPVVPPGGRRATTSAADLGVAGARSTGRRGCLVGRHVRVRAQSDATSTAPTPNAVPSHAP